MKYNLNISHLRVILKEKSSHFLKSLFAAFVIPPGFIYFLP